MESLMYRLFWRLFKIIKLELGSVQAELLGILLFTLGRPVFNLFCFTTIHHLLSQGKETWTSVEVCSFHYQLACISQDKTKTHEFCEKPLFSRGQIEEIKS